MSAGQPRGEDYLSEGGSILFLIGEGGEGIDAKQKQIDVQAELVPQPKVLAFTGFHPLLFLFFDGTLSFCTYHIDILDRFNSS